MTNAIQTLELADGRSLEFVTLGDPSGATVVYHHGTPGSVHLAEGFAEQVAKHNLFLIGMSRAGYGNSSRHQGRSVANVVSDVRELLRHLGRGQYVAVGWSGGGPHALACAALDPSCLHAISLAGVAPVVDDFDWTEGMGPENIEEFELARQGGPAYEAAMAHAVETFSGSTAENVVELFGGLLSDIDKQSLASVESRELLARGIAMGLNTNGGGFMDDDQAFLSDWGFDVADIATPVTLFFGDEDLMVPARHGHYLGSTIPNVTVRHMPAEGHVSLVLDHGDEIFSVVKGVFQ